MKNIIVTCDSPALLTTGQHFVTRFHCARQKMTRISQEFLSILSGNIVEKRWPVGWHVHAVFKASLPITSSAALFALGHPTCAAFPPNIKRIQKSQIRFYKIWIWVFWLVWWSHRPILKKKNPKRNTFLDWPPKFLKKITIQLLPHF